MKIQKLLAYRLEQEDLEYLNSIITQLDEKVTQKEKLLKN
jgi:hypothetical protein